MFSRLDCVLTIAFVSFSLASPAVLLAAAKEKPEKAKAETKLAAIGKVAGFARILTVEEEEFNPSGNFGPHGKDVRANRCVREVTT